jgi:ribosomal protein L11 methylase PrmA
MQHHLFYMTLGGKLHLAPVKDPKLVLDFGTGTGIWAIDYGKQRSTPLMPISV